MADQKPILVVGGGISGLTVALEAAEVGNPVILVEKEPFLGGRVSRMNQYFPKLCPPYCGLEINFKRVKQNPGIEVLTSAEVGQVSGQAGDFKVTLKVNPTFVNENCTACGECVAACPVERANDFNYGMDRTKAVYFPHDMAFPARYAIDGAACKGSECGECAKVCKYGAIELGMKAKTREVSVGAVVFATGWQPYDAKKIDNLGFGASPDIITNVMMERLASANGPTEGKILRPSDGKEPKTIAFVQCAGSRDENHMEFCSAVCCTASVKQVTYIREKLPEAKIKVFYIDLRTPGRLEDFLAKVQEYENVSFVKGKVAKITKQGTGLLLEVEDTLSGNKLNETADLVVLATGMLPNTAGLPGVTPDANGFGVSGQKGILFAGCVKQPLDVSLTVQDATGVAMKALQACR
ncbi:MAG: CoB--CoM heterodisulfide reductase iron-sulfur subunit A family protein [bacterium]